MGNCKKLGIELLLIAFFCVMATGFIITYVVAVHNDHVSPYFPYISDTGSESPESCIFGFVCSVGAILVMGITYIRHKQVHEFYVTKGTVNVNCLNYLASTLGALSVLGLLLVGSFQDNKVPVVHFIGAYFVFGFGCLYAWVQLLISYRISRVHSSPGKCLLLIKLLICIVGSSCFIGTMVTGPIAKKYYDGNTSCVHCWEEDDGGYALHIFSTVLEWIMSFAFLIYFLTFHSDFTSITVDISVKSRYHHSDDNYLPINEKTPLT